MALRRRIGLAAAAAVAIAVVLVALISYWAVRGQLDVVSLELQRPLQRPPHSGLVIHHQDPGHGAMMAHGP